MATARLRDLEVLRAGLTAWLRQAYPAGSSLVVADLTHASAGWSNETLLVTIGTNGFARARADRVPGRVVVRLPPLQPSFPGADDPARQGAVHEAVAGAGVPAPAPVTVVDDERWLGVPFLVMPYVAGHVPGQAPALDPWVTGSSAALQRALYEGFVDTVAAVNRVDWATAGLGTVVRGGAPAAGGARLARGRARLVGPLRGVVLRRGAPGWPRRGVGLVRGDPPGARRPPVVVVGGRPPGQPGRRRGPVRAGGARLGAGLDRAGRAGPGLAARPRVDHGRAARSAGRRVPRARGDRFPLRGRAGPAGHRPGLARGLRPGSLAGGEQPPGPRRRPRPGARYAMGADERNPLVALVRRRIADAGG